MSTNSTKFIVCIDGPAASGKGTVALEIAHKLGFFLLPSGVFYRGFAYLLWRYFSLYTSNTALSPTKLIQLLREYYHNLTAPEAWLPINNSNLLDFFEKLPEYLENKSLIHDIGVFLQEEWLDAFATRGHPHQPELAKITSKIATIQVIREVLNEKMRALALARPEPGIVAEGRDAGTVIFPDAQCKIFLTARLQIRAARRLAQLQQSTNTRDAAAENVDFASILEDMRARDWQDSTRTIAPTRMAPDAWLLDSSFLDKAATVERIIEELQSNRDFQRLYS